MLDPKLIRNKLQRVAEALKIRNVSLDQSRLSALEDQRKAAQRQAEDLQNERNRQSKSIGQAKAQGQDIQPLLDAVGKIGDELGAAEKALADIQDELSGILRKAVMPPDLSGRRVPSRPAQNPEGHSAHQARTPAIH